jgi:hypothetical protein
MNEEVISLLQDIYDEALHIINTEADYHKEVAIEDAKVIKDKARLALIKLEARLPSGVHRTEKEWIINQ